MGMPKSYFTLTELRIPNLMLVDFMGNVDKCVDSCHDCGEAEKNRLKKHVKQN